MAELLIVADDLTGALDTGVPFAEHGIPTCVTLDLDRTLATAGDRFPVLVVDTQSRHLDGAEAARRVAAAVRRGREAGVRYFFKKTDSTLRGNLGAELDALRTASGVSQLAFVPALPALGRTTLGGVQHVHGRPLHETEFAADPLEPVRSSSVRDLIRRQSDVHTVALGRDDLRAEPGRPLREPGVLLFDAESEADVGEIREWLEGRGLLGATAGTAALARELARRPPWGGPAPACPPERPVPAGPGMLVVGGSLNRVSLAQLSHAAAHGFAAVELPAAALVTEGGHRSAAADQCVAAAARHLARGAPALLRGAGDGSGLEACLALGRRHGMEARDVHLRVAENTGRIVHRILDAQRPGLVVVMGGDTLAGVARALGGGELLPRYEALPGVVVSEIGFPGAPLLVSKAGGFGPQDVLTRIRRAFTKGARE